MGGLRVCVRGIVRPPSQLSAASARLFARRIRPARRTAAHAQPPAALALVVAADGRRLDRAEKSVQVENVAPQRPVVIGTVINGLRAVPEVVVVGAVLVLLGVVLFLAAVLLVLLLRRRHASINWLGGQCAAAVATKKINCSGRRRARARRRVRAREESAPRAGKRAAAHAKKMGRHWTRSAVAEQETGARSLEARQRAAPTDEYERCSVWKYRCTRLLR